VTRASRTPLSILVARPLLALAVIAGLGLDHHPAEGRDCAEADPAQHGVVFDFPFDVYSVVVDGDRAYVLRELPVWTFRMARLAIYDISTPELQELGGSESVFPPNHPIFEVAGGFAYVASTNTFHVIDVSDPAALQEASSYGLEWPIDPAGIAVAGKHVYIGDETGLLVVDVADPAAPSVIGRVAFPAKALSVALVGSIAYVGTLDARLAAVDVSDPAEPAVVATVALPGAPWGIEVRGSHAYVADGESGLQIVDVSRATHPRLLGGVDSPGDARLVALSGARAYVVDRRITSWPGEVPGTDLQVIDVSNPMNPVIVNSVAGADSLDAKGYWVRTEARSVAVSKGQVIVGTGVSHEWSGDCLALLGPGCGYSSGCLSITPRSNYEAPPPCSDHPAGAGAVAFARASDTSIPATFALRGNDPNPFNPETAIRFDVPRASRVRIQVYDARGRLVKTLVDGALSAGRHKVSWRGRAETGEAAASGIYFVSMEAETFRQTRKITLLK